MVPTNNQWMNLKFALLSHRCLVFYWNNNCPPSTGKTNVWGLVRDPGWDRDIKASIGLSDCIAKFFSWTFSSCVCVWVTGKVLRSHWPWVVCTWWAISLRELLYRIVLFCFWCFSFWSYMPRFEVFKGSETLFLKVLLKERKSCWVYKKVKEARWRVLFVILYLFFFHLFPTLWSWDGYLHENQKSSFIWFLKAVTGAAAVCQSPSAGSELIIQRLWFNKKLLNLQRACSSVLGIFPISSRCSWVSLCNSAQLYL